METGHRECLLEHWYPMTTTQKESRAHHFVPQCWLAGFTDTGQKDGMLYVSDLKRKKQWRCKPSEVGHRRDFNRVEDPSVPDPLAIEKIFANIESTFCALSRNLDREKRGPFTGEELGVLTGYMTIQATRTPAFRKIIDGNMKSEVASWLKSRESWETMLHRAGIPLDSDGADYESAQKALASGEITFSAPPGFYLQSSAQVVEEISASFQRRFWNNYVSPTGQFIGSDSPVSIDGEKDRPVGFENAEIVSYPVSRHVVIFGTPFAISLEPLTTKLVARHNTFAMLSADEQVYSHRPDFHWVDKTGTCQNDWTLFSKDEFC